MLGKLSRGRPCLTPGTRRSTYIIRGDGVSQDICNGGNWPPISSNISNGQLTHLMTDSCAPIEFSLAQSLHFWTMLALPRPPFSGTLSCRHRDRANVDIRDGKFVFFFLNDVFLLTIRVTYCHLSGTSPQFPHFS